MMTRIIETPMSQMFEKMFGVMLPQKGQPGQHPQSNSNNEQFGLPPGWSIETEKKEGKE
jgi:hypothetical protein